jgi:hypothetical protein
MYRLRIQKLLLRDTQLDFEGSLISNDESIGIQKSSGVDKKK